MGLDKEFRIEELIQSGSKAIVSLNEEGQQTYNVASPEGDRDGETFGYLETPKYNQSEANKVVDTVVDELIGEEAQIQSERYVLKSVYDGLSREFDNLSDQIENLQTQINALNSQIASLESEKTSLTSQVQSKDGIIASLQEQVTRLNGEIQSLNAEKQQLQNQIEDLKTQISQQSDQITSLNAQIDSLNKQIEALRGEIQVKNETITSNENELNDLRLQIRDLRNQLQQANSQNISLAGSLTDARDQNTQLSQQNSSLQSQLSQATSTIAQLRQTINELRSRLNEPTGTTQPPTTQSPTTQPPTTQPPTTQGLTSFVVSRGTTEQEACSGAGRGIIWGNSSVFENVTQWFRNAQGDSFNSGNGLYAYEGKVMFINENGSVSFVSDCPTTTSTTTTQPPTNRPRPELTSFSVSRGSSPQEACSGANSAALWGNSSVFENVTQWFRNSQGDSFNSGNGFYAYEGQVMLVNNNGSVTFVENCPTTTTTNRPQPQLTSFSVSRGATQQEACSNGNPVTLWGNSSVFENVTQWYSNSQGSIIASFGFYAYDGQVVSVNSNGSVSFVGNCPTTQPSQGTKLVYSNRRERSGTNSKTTACANQRNTSDKYPMYLSESVGKLDSVNLINKRVFDDSNLSSTWAGQDKWYGISKLQNGKPVIHIKVDENGVITAQHICSGGSSTRTTQSSSGGSGGSGGFIPEIDSGNPSGDPGLNNGNIFNVF